jgi:hypothetical protein
VIAALYVATGGAYYGLPDVDPWDEARDARLYAGPWPVVAHPPCGPWGKLAHFCKQDASCGPAAVASVRRWGGVLEHPAGSRLFRTFGMPFPGELCPDAWGGRTYAVNQLAWGHPCDKPTWLYVVGGPAPEVRSGGVPKKRVKTDMRNRSAKPLPDANKSERLATPPAFRDLLLSLARASRPAARGAA